VSGRRGQTRAVARHPASNTPAAKRPPSPRVRRRRAALRTALLGLGLVGFLFAFVYPTSTFLSQRTRIDEGEARIARLEEQTELLAHRNEELEGDAAVERIAREQYGLVRPGETPYVLVPSVPTTTVAPPTTKAP
jgi:cell division protein FtsB